VDCLVYDLVDSRFPRYSSAGAGMRFDGHVKITLQALDILTNLSKRKDVLWSAPAKKVTFPVL